MSRLQQGLPAVRGHFKDAILAELATHGNVAQFVSFEPGAEPAIRHICAQRASDTDFQTVEGAVAELLRTSVEHSVNVRAFDPEQPRSHEFLYGLTDVTEVAGHIRRLAAQGLFTIANETVDVSDGGVSGVVYGGVVEFAPDDTPRCVEKPGTASFSRELGLGILETVYGFRPDLNQPDEVRTEFSVHPVRRGVHNTHTILWEEERTEPIRLEAKLVWPNRFSRFLGDKAFGLLVADAVGLPVPATTVVARRVAPFSFGRLTGTGERWIRTCPFEPVPGRFTTRRGWIDPYVLLAQEDPEGTSISSVLSQEGVEAEFSGAAATAADGAAAIIEGVRGVGDKFMLGTAAPEELPIAVVADVEKTLSHAGERVGPVRLEWVHDGERAWVVQLHPGLTASRGYMIYPGKPTFEHRFLVEHGLEALRELAARLQGTGEGVVIVGRVGVTSHLGDVLRRARVPSRIELPTEEYATPPLFERAIE